MKTYQRLGKKAIFCRCRKMLLLDTPEERVRQCIVNHLIDVCGVPESHIKTEVPLCHYRSGAKGRADILVLNADEVTPLLVVETKACGFSTGAPVEQAERYARVLSATYIAIACSNDAEAIAYYKLTGTGYQQLSDSPSYKDLIGRKKLKIEDDPVYFRYKPKAFSDELFQQFFADVYGEDTTPELVPHFLSLWNFLLTEPIVKLPIKKFNFIIVEDKGISLRSYGNAAGGSYPGFYRGFMLKDTSGDHQLVRIGMFGTEKTENHPVFGNRKSITCLNIAIDDFDNTPHNALQYRLDDYTELKDNHLVFWHNGTMTAGKTGSVKRSVVLDYMKRRAPYLVVNGQIYLGKVPTKNPCWADGQDFVSRILSYALLRDQLRAEIRETATER